jgi:hypothetical protein
MKVGERFNPAAFDDGTWVPDWLMERDELELTHKIVYARLRRYAYKIGHCWPFKKTLALGLKLDEKTIERSIGALEREGLIEVERPGDRRELPAQDLAIIETSGNRYFFLKHQWMPEYSDTAQTSRPKPTDLKSVGDRLKVGCPTDLKSVPSTKRVIEEDQRRELGPLASRDVQHAEGPAIRERNEEHQDTEGSGSAPPTELGEDLGVLDADGNPRVDRARAAAQRHIQQGAGKLQEHKARDAARRQKKLAKEADKRRQEQELGVGESEKQEGSPLGRIHTVWREEFRKAFPDSPMAWGGKQFGQAKHILDLYEIGQVENAIAYLLHNWKAIRARMFKDKGDVVPSVGTLLSFHDSLVPNAALWVKHRDVLDRYASYDPNPDVDRPEALWQEYAAARKELKALGL